MSVMKGLRTTSRRWFCLLVAGLALVSASPAFAQQPARLSGEESVTLQWVIAFGIMIVIGVSAFLNPKRSHLN